jgi:hypothetical protein
MAAVVDAELEERDPAGAGIAAGFFRGHGRFAGDGNDRRDEGNAQQGGIVGVFERRAEANRPAREGARETLAKAAQVNLEAAALGLEENESEEGEKEDAAHRGISTRPVH